MVRICSARPWFLGPLFLLSVSFAGCGSGIADGCLAFGSCGTAANQPVSPGTPTASPIPAPVPSPAPTTPIPVPDPAPPTVNPTPSPNPVVPPPTPVVPTPVVPTPTPVVLPTWVNGFTWIGQSTDTGVYQGYATDGADAHYFFDTGSIYKSSSYLQNLPLVSNRSPLIDGTKHLGDGAYYAGKVYAIAENWRGCGAPPSRAAIVVFDGQTLERLSYTDITLSHHETSSITILPDTKEAVVSSYCDGTQLFVYSLPSFQLTRTIPLPNPVAQIQGITYNGGFIYIADNNGALYGLRLADGEQRKLHQAPFFGEYEGLDFKNGELRWLINRSDGQHILYRYAPN